MWTSREGDNHLNWECRLLVDAGKGFFLTKIKVLFDPYHQQMMPIPPELDMQVPGRLL